MSSEEVCTLRGRDGKVQGCRCPTLPGGKVHVGRASLRGAWGRLGELGFGEPGEEVWALGGALEGDGEPGGGCAYGHRYRYRYKCG